MNCRLSDLRYKEVVSVTDGRRLGYVCDAEIDIATGQLLSLIVPGPCRFFGLFWREDDYILPYTCISRIGDDIILIETKGEQRRGRRGKRAYF